jgi:hypothetical protein
MSSLLPLTRYITSSETTREKRGEGSREDNEEEDGEDDERSVDLAPRGLSLSCLLTDWSLHLTVALSPREAMGVKLKKMAEGLCEVLDDVGLISFIAMNIQDGEVWPPSLFSPDSPLLPSSPSWSDCESSAGCGGPSERFQLLCWLGFSNQEDTHCL